MGKSNISYSAIVLDDKSKSKLLSFFDRIIPNDWKKVAHHMTINLGSLPEDLTTDLGKTVTLEVIGYGINDNVLAAKVDGYPSSNKNPHITIAINTNNGAKPNMAKNLDVFEAVSPFEISGVVSEIGNQVQTEDFNGFPNDVEYEKTGNEGSGVSTLEKPMSARDYSYDKGGNRTTTSTASTMLTLREQQSAIVVSKNDILRLISE